MKNNSYPPAVKLLEVNHDACLVKSMAGIERLVQPEDSWSEQTINELLTQDINQCWVVLNEHLNEDSNEKPNKDASQIIAYCLFSQVFEVGEILRIGTHPDYQRRGLAQQLLTQLIKQMPEKQLERILLEVRADNEPAIALYNKLGFAIIHIRKDYYAHPVCDALIMAYQI